MFVIARLDGAQEMTAPEDLPDTIAGRELVAEIPGMRVEALTPDPGEVIPWRYHSRVTGVFVCLEGATVVETRAPRARHELGPGGHCVVPPRTAHEVGGKDGKGCRFAIVQGVGEHDFMPVGGVA